MNIRIGNDIKVKITLPSYINPSMIRRITANLNKVHNIHHHNCHTNLYHPTEYTLHKHSCMPYNVLPRNVVFHLHECFCHRDHCSDNMIVIKPTGSNVIQFVCKTRNYKPGEYRLVLNIQVQEDGWDRDDIHEYTIDYGSVFSLSYNKDAKDGYVVLNINKEDGPTPDPDPLPTPDPEPTPDPTPDPEPNVTISKVNNTSVLPLELECEPGGSVDLSFIFSKSTYVLKEEDLDMYSDLGCSYHHRIYNQGRALEYCPSLTAQIGDICHIKALGVLVANIKVIAPAVVDPFNGHDYVDLGLPSGTMWATCNVGATSPEKPGKYFKWGDVIGTTKNDVSSKTWNWSTYEFNGGSSQFDEEYFNTKKNTLCPNGKLAKQYDAASVNMGGDWCMPTKEQFQELYDNTTQELYNNSGVYGIKYISKTDSSKYIITPNAGYIDDLAKESYLNREDGIINYNRDVYMWSCELCAHPNFPQCAHSCDGSAYISTITGNLELHVVPYDFDNYYIGMSVRGVIKQ